MEQIRNPHPRQARTSEQRASLLEAWRNSQGKTIKAFCAEQNIPAGTFYNWLKRYKKKQAVKPERAGFVKLTIAEALPDKKDSSLFAEVNGIRLYREVSAAYLKALLP